MRLGKKDTKARGWKRAGEKLLGKKPKHVSAETVIGIVSPDLIRSVYAPKFLDVANVQLEEYAGNLLDYQVQLSEEEATKNGTDNSSVATASLGVLSRAPPVPMFHSQFTIDEFESTLLDVSDYFFTKTTTGGAGGGGWKIAAKAAKFERLLDERYGVFRPFVKKHPEVEHALRAFQRKYAGGYFSPFRQSDPPIPRSTAIILLFMMQRGGMRWEITLLSFLFFIIGLQPWALVAFVVLAHHLVSKRKYRPIGAMKNVIPAVEPFYNDHDSLVGSVETTVKERKQSSVKTKIGTPLLETCEIDTSEFDTLIFGHGPGPLYAASLLSRAGRRVMVLSPRSDASGCLTLEKGNVGIMQKYESIPFDVEASNVPKVSKLQNLLAPALSTTTDYQGGIRFAQIGREADGFAFDILSIPGCGTENRNHEIPFIIKASGSSSLMEDAATFLGDGWPDSDGGVGNSSVGAYVGACEHINSTANTYYMGKIMGDNFDSLRNDSAFQESAICHASPFLNRCFPQNVHLRSIMAGIGMKGENIKPSATSMAAHASNVCAAMSGEGMHYPIGGPRALCKALANVVERSGGRIYTNALVKELIFEEDKSPVVENATRPEDGPCAPRCVGVMMADGRVIRFNDGRYKGAKNSSIPAVVSFYGLIDTFIRLLDENTRNTYKVPRGLPALSEQRPVFKILFLIRGNADELDLTGADYYRLPKATVAFDTIDPATGIVSFGEIGGNKDVGADEEFVLSRSKKDMTGNSDLNLFINQDPSEEEVTKTGAKMKGRKLKFNTGESWVHISFPSAKDPSFESCHGKVSTCVVTIEADDDFVTAFDTKPKLFIVNKETSATRGNVERLLERVTKDLVEIYPQLVDCIEHSEVRGPFQRGLSHNPERYAAKGVRADTLYPRLFVGGSDLTVGESFAGEITGGWLVANAVVGYSAIDHLYFGKNITSDISRFMELPTVTSEEDLAVPFDSLIQSEQE
jgi:hypothetical protein